MTKRDIIDLMLFTGSPLIVRATEVKKWRFRHSQSWLQVGVTPTLRDRLGAYRAFVGMTRVPIRGAVSLMNDCTIRAIRKWHVKGVFRLRKTEP